MGVWCRATAQTEQQEGLAGRLRGREASGDTEEEEVSVGGGGGDASSLFLFPLSHFSSPWDGWAGPDSRGVWREGEAESPDTSESERGVGKGWWR